MSPGRVLCCFLGAEDVSGLVLARGEGREEQGEGGAREGNVGWREGRAVGVRELELLCIGGIGDALMDERDGREKKEQKVKGKEEWSLMVV